MNKKLYVGNLPFDIQESSLQEMFEAEGGPVIKVQIISDRDTGRSRGFGFVEFENADDAQKAIEAIGRIAGNSRFIVVHRSGMVHPAPFFVAHSPPSFFVDGMTQGWYQISP